jgi:hypothetical protein
MPYDWATRWAGVFERHADFCPFSDGQMCECGPLGYIAAIEEPGTGARVTSPLLDTVEEARAWRREQEWAVAPRPAAASNGHGSAGVDGHANGNGNGNGSPTRPLRMAPAEPEAEEVLAYVGRQARARAAGGDRAGRRPPRVVRPIDSNPSGPPHRLQDENELPVAALIERFLDAAEDGEARTRDGHPYSDDELAELEWALSGYVGSHFGGLDAGTVRGRHVFKLIDELEDAGMPRSRLRAVVDSLRALFDYAVDLGLIRVNPATYVAVPADDRAPRKRLVDTLETRVARPRGEAAQDGGNMISERAIWMSVKIVTLAFICIALILVAESV